MQDDHSSPALSIEGPSGALCTEKGSNKKVGRQVASSWHLIWVSEKKETTAKDRKDKGWSFGHRPQMSWQANNAIYLHGTFLTRKPNICVS